jgi:hypothetical protein
LSLLNDDPALAHQARQFLALAPHQEIPLRSAVESQSYVTLADEMSRRARPGWAVLAAAPPAAPSPDPEPIWPAAIPHTCST